MQQIYMQSNEHFEVFTTVFSPQVCRARTRYRHREAEKMVVAVNYRPHWPDELELRQGDVIHVLFKDDESWWFGRRQNGQEGYFPATYVNKIVQKDDPAKASPSLLKRGSSQDTPAEGLEGCTSRRASLRSPRIGKEGIFRTLGPDGSAHFSDGSAQSSPSLLHRILSRSRRRSEGPGDLNGTINGAFEPD
ncbi:hypothetical protein MATL_G00253090 [Megalops atlanticus]|uniref:SH3 domain-containing protein n=1 Tax=Megalops atlanticus TaxID=7932 RepID=A0A9D3STU0_MEGAT|nr:hypothetical protein MATL_G00253090 [Megalops atlanticus]